VTNDLYSFFSGAGFLDLGFEDQGFEVAYANEFYKPFADAYIYSRTQLSQSRKPQVDLTSIEDLFDKKPLDALKSQMRDSRRAGNLVGFVGGPPCPDFSVGGKNKGSTGENGRLSASYVELIIATKPEFFLFENVKGLWRTHRHRAFYEEMKNNLRAAGYTLSERLINALEYGVPQDRERIILIGFLEKGERFNIREETWLKYTTKSIDLIKEMKWPEAGAYTSDSPPPGIDETLTVRHWFDKNDVENHPNANDSFTPRAGLSRFIATLEGDVSRKSYKRLHRHRFSPTAAYGNNEVHIHPWYARRISAAEAMAIQSLPKEFALPQEMTLSAKFKTIGNGVPFLAARAIARMVDDTLKGGQL
jgi:DNA (cytosine-5)-methyltransferase 1